MYDSATYFAWFVLSLIFFIAVGMIVWLGSMPAKIAAKRNHPQVQAINACSWWGLAFGGVGWVIAFVWALIKHHPTPSTASDTDDRRDLLNRIEALENQLVELRGK